MATKRSKTKQPAKPKSQAAAAPDLAAIRARIDGIDQHIQSLIQERAEFARQVGVAKGPLKAAVMAGLGISFVSAHTVQIELAAGPTHAAVRQAAIVTSEESRGIDFTFGDGSLVLAGKAAVQGRPTAYVCRGPRCTAPITDPSELAERLGRPEPL